MQLFLLCWFCFFSPEITNAHLSPQTLPFAERYVTAPSGLNMRATASLSGKVVAKLPYGAEVTTEGIKTSLTVGGRTGEWEKVRYQGQVGYVFNVYLSIIPAPQPLASKDDCEQYTWYGYEPLLREYLKEQLTSVSEEVVLLEGQLAAEESFHESTLRRYEKGIVVFKDLHYESSTTTMRIWGMRPEQVKAWVEAMIEVNCPGAKPEMDPFTLHHIDYYIVELMMESGV